MATTRKHTATAMGLLYELIVDTEAGTTTVQLEANSKEEALESAQELYPGCRLALVNPEPGAPARRTATPIIQPQCAHLYHKRSRELSAVAPG